jgi:hypothetical protein
VVAVASVVFGSLVYGAPVKATDDLLESDGADAAAACVASARALPPLLAVYLVLGVVSLSLA